MNPLTGASNRSKKEKPKLEVQTPEYLIVYGRAPFIQSDRWCCGARMLGGFLTSIYPLSGGIHMVTVEQAAGAIAILMKEYPTAGITTAITNHSQSKVWNPALEKNGFTCVKKFVNRNGNTLSLYMDIRLPAEE